MTEKDLKPCIVCGKECSIYGVQLGDSFTLVHLRLCSGECLFELAHEYLYKLYEHRNFRNTLYDLEDKEDRKKREEMREICLNAFLEDFGKHLKENKDLLSRPMPKGVYETFAEKKTISMASAPIKLIKASKSRRIKLHKEYIEEQRKRLLKAEKDLKQIEEEK